MPSSTFTEAHCGELRGEPIKLVRGRQSGTDIEIRGRVFCFLMFFEVFWQFWMVWCFVGRRFYLPDSCRSSVFIQIKKFKDFLSFFDFFEKNAGWIFDLKIKEFT